MRNVEKGNGGKADHEPLTVSVAEAARLLGVSKPTMYNIARKADLPSFRVGGRRLIVYAGLKRWVEEQAQRGDS